MVFWLPALTACKFALAQLIVIFLPGYALGLFLINRSSLVNRITLSYALGYCLNLLEYLVSYGIGVHQPIALSIVIALGSIIVIVKKPLDDGCRYQNEDILPTMMWLVYMLIAFVAYSGNDISPFSNNIGTSINRDIQYWASNSVALKIGFPPSFSFMDGTVLNYHYFSSMQIAFLSQVSGISIFDLSFTLYAFGKSVLLVGAINVLCDELEIRKGKWFCFLLILLMTGFENRSVVTYVWHSLTGPFGFDIGLAFGILFVSCIIKQWKANELDARNLAITLLFWFALIGAKTPIALILLFIPGFLCFAWLFMRKYRIALSYGLPILALFFLENGIFTGAFLRIGTESHTSILRIYDLDQIIHHYTGIDAVDIIATLVLNLFYTHPVLFLLSTASIIALVVLVIKRKIDPKTILLACGLLVSSIAGFALGIFMDVGGKSEMYYSMAAFIPCAAFVFVVAIAARNAGVSRISRAVQLVNIPLALLAVFGVALFCFFGYGSRSLVPELIGGYEKIAGIYEYPQSNFFDIDEAKAAAWIRDNAPENAIVVSDRESIGGQTGSYYYAIFTERQQYMEATDLLTEHSRLKGSNMSILDEIERRQDVMTNAYDGQIDAIQQLRADGVDYMVRDARFSEAQLDNVDMLCMEHQSGAVTVYKITER